MLALNEQIGYIEKKFDILKNAYFDSKSLSLKALKQRLRIQETTIITANKRILFKYADSYHFADYKKTSDKKQIIYLFGDSRLISTRNKIECKLDFMLSQLLNKHEDYEVQNYSFPASNELQIICQLTIAPLVRNSIVIMGIRIGFFSNFPDPYTLVLIKQYCQEYNCRLICYFLPNMFSRKFLSDYEKFYIEKCTLQLPDRGDGTLSKKQKNLLRTMDIDFYEPPDSFFNSEKVIYIDFLHFGDYGNEIIAKHLHDIIVNKAKSNNFFNVFSIEPEAKIKYTFSIISSVVPDIRFYLTN
jgi:hypothetical protein